MIIARHRLITAQHGLLVLGMVVVILLVQTATQGCPNCFESADKQVVSAYYIGALLLSATPFGIVGSILLWLFLHKRRIQRSNQARSDHNENLKLGRDENEHRSIRA